MISAENKISSSICTDISLLMKKICVYPRKFPEILEYYEEMV